MDRPDAVLIPESYKGPGTTQYQRIDSLLEIVEPILRVDRVNGEAAYIRRQPGGECFVTRDPLDTIKHPKSHPEYPGQARYRWDAHPALQGVLVGYLKEGRCAP